MTSLTQICLQKNQKIIETKCTNTIRTKLSTNAMIPSKDFQPLPDTLHFKGCEIFNHCQTHCTLKVVRFSTIARHTAL